MKRQFTVDSVEGLQPVVDVLLGTMHEGEVVCFQGPLGAGKTTLIKALCRTLEVQDPLSSPSFGLVNEYEGRGGLLIFHFDLYRLNDPEELLDIGWYDYLDQADFIFVEWPEKASDYIPEDALRIFMEPKNTSREITITY